MKSTNLKKFQSTFLVSIIVMTLISAIMMATGMVKVDWFAPKPLANIYGIWTEQEVAHYAADSFELRASGVFVNGRQISTHYQWDGNTLSYRLGDDVYLYNYLSNRLVRQQPAHYISTFARTQKG
ncbi:DUF2850 domain-containing protein [Photobacterium frigidiphilum]|uniref:DUF2850 domain-containing protein n=1 Tax=Photobacterium frigidiphilum TaxID=264736 RepID=UPI003D0CA987